MNNYLLEKQLSFSKNIECCREVIFDLRYLDVTNYIGLAESTMISYDILKKWTDKLLTNGVQKIYN